MLEISNWRDHVRTIKTDDGEYVVLNEIAPLIGYEGKVRTPSNSMQKWLAQRNFPTFFVKAKLDSGKIQTVLAMLASDVDKVIEIRKLNRENRTTTKDRKGIIFYIFQLFHKKHPDVVVLGITEQSVQERMVAYQSNQKKLLREYPLSSRGDEQTLIKMMCNCEGCEKLGNEVVSITDIDAFLNRADKIVGLLPKEQSQENMQFVEVLE